jgi:transcription factor SPN1
LFADSDDEEDKPKKVTKPLTKRERIEALQKKKRQDAAAASQRKKTAKRIDVKPNTGEAKEAGYDSGDSYNSATFVRTKEDNDFIDIDGEDEDAVRELYAEQHFDDERPDGESDDEDGGGRKKKKSGGGSKHKGPDHVSDDEDKDNPIMEAVHKMKRKKRTAKKQTELEDEAKAFIGKMDSAADDDEQAIKAKSPATKKLAMLAEVLDMLARRDMIRLLLDMDVLASCKRWIQPLPNGQLGNVTVRQRLIEAIGNMTGEQGITSNDLKRSGIGQTVMMLYKHKSETPNMKRDLKKLIEQWSRPIFQKSGNMKDLEQAHATRRPPQGISAVASMRKAPPKTEPQTGDGRSNKDNLHSLIASGKTGVQKEGLNRVRVPFSTGFDFRVRPQSKTGDIQDKRMIRPGQPKDNRGNLSKRMTEKGRAATKNQRSANISTVGRPVK